MGEIEIFKRDHINMYKQTFRQKLQGENTWQAHLMQKTLSPESSTEVET